MVMQIVKLVKTHELLVTTDRGHKLLKRLRLAVIACGVFMRKDQDFAPACQLLMGTGIAERVRGCTRLSDLMGHNRPTRSLSKAESMAALLSLSWASSALQSSAWYEVKMKLSSWSRVVKGRLWAGLSSFLLSEPFWQRQEHERWSCKLSMQGGTKGQG